MVRDRAVLASVVVGLSAYLVINLVDSFFLISVPSTSIPLALGIITYFAASQWLITHA